MRKINYDEYMREKKDKFFELRAIMGWRRGARRKPRDPEERTALRQMDYERYRKWIESGQLVEVSPRKYKMKIF